MMVIGFEAGFEAVASSVDMAGNIIGFIININKQ